MARSLTSTVELYKRLDLNRTLRGLGPREEKQWLEAKEALERASSSADAPPSSRRSSLRVPADLEVTFEDSQGFSEAYLRNISEGGVYVESERPLEMGFRFKLKILVEQPHKTIELPVEVVWVNRNPSAASGLEPGVGVAFLDLSDEHKAAIKGIVHYALDELARAADEVEAKERAAGFEPAPTTVRLPEPDGEVT